jgi:glycosyltransferase involved in cell wall biosynthesis
VRILLATESYYPNISGVSVATFLLAKTLVQQGHCVSILAPSTDFTDREERSSDLDGLLVHRLRAIGNPFRPGFRVSFLRRKKAAQYVRRIEPDIVHLHDPAGISAGALAGARALGIPVVITHHFTLDYVVAYMGFLGPAKNVARRMLVRYLTGFYNQADAVIAPSETVAKMLVGWGVKTNVSAISNGVPIERFYSYSPPSAILRRYHLPTQVPLVLYVGRIDRDKSIEVLIEAVPRVLARTRAHFVLVGGGESRAKCVKRAEQLGVAEAVTLVGEVPHESDDLPQLYQVATVFVIPSAVESQSIVTLEAMAAGLPIVAANAGALTELVVPGENGLLFAPGDSASLADCVARLLADRELAARFGRESLVRAGRHRIEMMHGHVLDVYETLRRQRRA